MEPESKSHLAKLRKLAPALAAGIAALAAAVVAARRRAGAALDGHGGEHAEDRMEDNATGEGMPERDA